MITTPLTITGHHPYAFRCGEPAKIIGVVMVDPENHLSPRPCFHVRFADGVEDWIPLSDVQRPSGDEAYKFAALEE